MLKFLFWNIGMNRELDAAHQKKLLDAVVDLTREHEIDVILLAENRLDIPTIENALNATEAGAYRHSPGTPGKIDVFVRFSPDYIKPVLEQPRYTIRQVSRPESAPWLLAACHIPSKLHWSPSSQAHLAKRMLEDIRSAEREEGHHRTVIVGDFNMNPFEEGMVSAHYLHAVMTRQIAEQGKRVVSDEEFAYFYNPIWSWYGDAGRTSAGTFYERRAEPMCYFWNAFDQVLISPELLAAFRDEDLIIPTLAGALPLVARNGIPDKSQASDHLPLVFALNLP